jgi:ATP-dependent Clp protease ATP-binding subunit ClpB
MAVAEDGDSDVVQACRDFGLTRSKIREWAREFRKGQNVTSDNPEGGEQCWPSMAVILRHSGQTGETGPGDRPG